jgi:hypothetical protein
MTSKFISHNIIELHLEKIHISLNSKQDAEVMEAITKGPAFCDRKLLHAYVL